MKQPRSTPADDEARAGARALLAEARHAALAVINPETGAPHLARVGLALAPSGQAMSLVSDLAPHTRALAADPRCALLASAPGARGDPRAHPRLTITAEARFPGEARGEQPGLRAQYPRPRPKARLHAGFADFHPVLFIPRYGLLNAGFGRAYRLEAADPSVPDSNTPAAPDP